MTNTLALILLAAGTSPIDAVPPAVDAVPAAVDVVPAPGDAASTASATGLGQPKRAASIVSTVTQQPAGSSETVGSSTVKRTEVSPATAGPQATRANAPQEIRAITSRERILRRRRALRGSLQGGQQQAMGELISLIQSTVAPDCWEFSGGGFSGFGAAPSGNNAGSGGQNAENLAELIQQTVRPLSWEINGGGGSISIFP